MTYPDSHVQSIWCLKIDWPQDVNPSNMFHTPLADLPLRLKVNMPCTRCNVSYASKKVAFRRGKNEGRYPPNPYMNPPHPWVHWNLLDANEKPAATSFWFTNVPGGLSMIWNSSDGDNDGDDHHDDPDVQWCSIFVLFLFYFHVFVADDDSSCRWFQKNPAKISIYLFFVCTAPVPSRFPSPGGFAISGYGSTSTTVFNRSQATVQAMGRTGYRCFLESPEASSKLGNWTQRLELGVSGWYGGWLGWGWGGWHRLTKKQRMCC